MNACRLGALYLQNVDEQLATLQGSLDQRKEIAQLRIRGVQKGWDRFEATFEWVSAYRTLRGIYATSPWFPDDRSFFVDGARKLAKELELEPEEMREGIRDHLLVCWREQESRRERRSRPGLLLQQDIDRAVEFWSLVAGEPVDLKDPYWSVSDRRPAPWSDLAEALPYEAHVARDRFPSQASIYLGSFNSSLPEHARLSEERVESILDLWWDHLVPLRRFVLAFLRLHDHYSGAVNEETLVQLKEETPIEFLLLSALLVEKILARVVENPSAKFRPLVKSAANLVLKPFQVPEKRLCMHLGDLLKDEKTNIYDLAKNPRDPFLSDEGLPTLDSHSAAFLRNFLNFDILRNYAAHHDAIDHLFIHHPVAEAAMEALVVVPLVVLASRSPE